MESALRDHFIPTLLGTDGPINNEFCLLLAKGIKQGGLAIRNPTDADARLHQASAEATALLVSSLLENTSLDIEAHAACVREAGAMARKEQI